MIAWMVKLVTQVVWTCLLIYFIELSKETLPGRFLINKAVEFSEFLIDLLRKIIRNNVTPR